ncbi:MAG TPA: dipeptide epimerase [Nitrospiraceae bacterium]|jgi:L-alanine-DL-glutamate epimerase-like enolase superfamily enzyme
MESGQFKITKVEYWPIDIPITEPFVVATGSRTVAENVFVRVTLASGAQGYGEAAPFPEVGGESRDHSLSALHRLGRTLLGRSAAEHADIGRQLAAQAPAQPAAWCGLETACVDAYCRASDVPMWELWGGLDVRERETDVTIPICEPDQTLHLARRWYAKGFRLFKMKVGIDVDKDIRRLEAVHTTLPGVTFIGDGNQGFSREDCLTFARGVKKFGGILVLLEQPVIRGDLDSMAAIRRDTGIPVAADESARCLADVHDVITRQAADYINIKIMKTGLVEALEIASLAKQAGLGLMIGGMVESRIAMGCSFSLVLGLGGFHILDLDTPLLLASDPVNGGYEYDGPRLVPWQTPGLGMNSPPVENTTIIE